MLRGVDVIAAAPGRVSTVRRGMPDVSYKAVGRDVITRRGLGNVVIINHGKGWRTIYAHLKKSSIRVAKGQRVKAGQVIGQVGMSGLAQVPHLHFGVLQNRKVIDPFNGTNSNQDCKSTGSPLWTAKALRKMRYPNVFILNAGFSDSSKFNRIALTYGLDEKDSFYRKAPNFIFAVDFSLSESSVTSPSVNLLIFSFVVWFNIEFGSNYWFTVSRPPGTNLALLFSDWPYYLYGLIIIGIISYCLTFKLFSRNISK